MIVSEYEYYRCYIFKDGEHGWTYWLYDWDDLLVLQIPGWSSELQARHEAYKFMETELTRIHSGFSVERHSKYPQYWQVAWYDWAGQLDTIEPGAFITYKVAINHAFAEWQKENREYEEQPTVNGLDGLQLALLMIAAQEQSNMSTESFEEKWRQGILGFIPNFEFN